MSSVKTYTVDVLIIGAGPAGIAAAVTLANYGKQVLIVDDGPDAGGQIWRAQPRKVSTQRNAEKWLVQLNHPAITRWHNCRFVRHQGERFFFADNAKMLAVQAQQIRAVVNFDVQLVVGESADFARFVFVDDGGAFAGLGAVMLVHAVVGDVEHAADAPLRPGDASGEIDDL